MLVACVVFVESGLRAADASDERPTGAVDDSDAFTVPLPATVNELEIPAAPVAATATPDVEMPVP